MIDIQKDKYNEKKLVLIVDSRTYIITKYDARNLLNKLKKLLSQGGN